MLDDGHKHEVDVFNHCGNCKREFSPLQELFSVVIGKLRPLFCDKQCYLVWLKTLKP